MWEMRPRLALASIEAKHEHDVETVSGHVCQTIWIDRPQQDHHVPLDCR